MGLVYWLNDRAAEECFGWNLPERVLQEMENLARQMNWPMEDGIQVNPANHPASLLHWRSLAILSNALSLGAWQELHFIAKQDPRSGWKSPKLARQEYLHWRDTPPRGATQDGACFSHSREECSNLAHNGVSGKKTSGFYRSEEGSSVNARGRTYAEVAASPQGGLTSDVVPEVRQEHKPVYSTGRAVLSRSSVPGVFQKIPDLSGYQYMSKYLAYTGKGAKVMVPNHRVSLEPFLRAPRQFGS